MHWGSTHFCLWHQLKTQYDSHQLLDLCLWLQKTQNGILYRNLLRWQCLFVMRIEKAVPRDVSPPGHLCQSMTSPLPALLLRKGPALGRETSHLTRSLPHLGTGVDIAAGTTEETAQRERACPEVSPWLSVTTQWDLSLLTRLWPGANTPPSTFSGLMGPIHSFFSLFPLLYFWSLLPEGELKKF